MNRGVDIKKYLRANWVIRNKKHQQKIEELKMFSNYMTKEQQREIAEQLLEQTNEEFLEWYKKQLGKTL